jgi:hypothetical protein
MKRELSGYDDECGWIEHLGSDAEGIYFKVDWNEYNFEEGGHFVERLSEWFVCKAFEPMQESMGRQSQKFLLIAPPNTDVEKSLDAITNIYCKTVGVKPMGNTEGDIH